MRKEQKSLPLISCWQENGENICYTQVHTGAHQREIAFHVICVILSNAFHSVLFRMAHPPPSEKCFGFCLLLCDRIYIASVTCMQAEMRINYGCKIHNLCRR